MDTEKHTKIVSFLREQISRAPKRVRLYIFNGQTGERYPNRNVFVRLRKYAQDFLNGNVQDRLIILSGLRGAGKTTLFAQIFSFLDTIPDRNKLYISLDEMVSLGLSLTEVLSVYEKDILETSFEALETPVFLFLDEVQYDENWAVNIKIIYDRTNKVCIFATGSSALALQGGRVGADIVRRARYERVFPMSFTEYLKIKYSKYEQRGLGGSIRDAFTQSTNAQDFFERMQSLYTRANRYLSDIDPVETMSYLKYGSLPFVLSEQDEQRIYERIRQVINKVVRDDIAVLGGFDASTVTKIPELLYTISNSDNVVVDSVSRNIGITRPVITRVLKSLEQTETLLRIYPYGSVSSQVRKPSKYTFMSSSLRATLFHTFGTILNEENYKGRLLEDAVALCLYRTFVDGNGWSLTYDSSQGGADFIVSKENKAIIVEVGFGDKNARQVKNTMQSVNKDTFGVVVSSQPLQIDKDKVVVNIPIELFLLM